MKAAAALMLASILASTDGYAWETTPTTQLVNRLVHFSRSSYDRGTVLEPDLLLVPFPDENAVTVGEGIDLITGRRKMQKCVVFPDIARTVYNNKETSFSEVTDEESLWRKLNTSISARASYAGYSGGGSYKSEVETKTSSKTITTVAQATLRTYVEGMSTSEGRSTSIIDLSPTAYQLARTKPASFRQTCGDGFVVQVTYGASLYGILQFTSSNFEKKQKTSIAVDASGPAGVFKVDGNTQFEEIFTKDYADVKVQTIEQGALTETIPSTREQLIASFESLGRRAKDNERPLFLTVLRYSTLPRGRDRRYVEVTSGLEAMVKRSLRLKTLLVEVRSAFAHRQAFDNDLIDNFDKHEYVFVPEIEEGYRTSTGLQDLGDLLQDKLDKTNDQIELCIQQSTKTACTVAEMIVTNDLDLRAVSPLPLNDIPASALQEIVNAARVNIEVSKKEAACKLARYIRQSKIIKTDLVRCSKDNECPRQELLNAASLKILDGLKYKDAACVSN
ncbi:hypothetical protein [Sinorhizobium meliloti]|uniref:hypothetical protein n=1 Tax=Rhizobium meliloti TaxID=382 RepID=UPI000FDBDE72|nr:hypothetical protein [Sinorhizobium meliloti]RVL61000.1 hypothetical protein CN137_17430 [Sinorhizobium meliloti]